MNHPNLVKILLVARAQKCYVVALEMLLERRIRSSYRSETKSEYLYCLFRRYKKDNGATAELIRENVRLS